MLESRNKPLWRWCSICLHGDGGALGFGGRAPVADRTDDIFSLPITYTVQKSGAPFNTVLGTSLVLNLLRNNIDVTIRINACIYVIVSLIAN